MTGRKRVNGPELRCPSTKKSSPRSVERKKPLRIISLGTAQIESEKRSSTRASENKEYVWKVFGPTNRILAVKSTARGFPFSSRSDPPPQSPTAGHHGNIRDTATEVARK